MKNGLKGVTDATVFCKSMKKGGPAPMIRSMKSYNVGGITDECSGTGTKPPRCRQVFKSKGKSKSGSGVLKTILSTLPIIGAGLYAAKKYGK